jgi:hypothetical protein
MSGSKERQTPKSEQERRRRKVRYITRDSLGRFVALEARPAPARDVETLPEVLTETEKGKQRPAKGVLAQTDAFLADLDRREDVQEILRRLAK